MSLSLPCFGVVGKGRGHVWSVVPLSPSFPVLCSQNPPQTKYQVSLAPLSCLFLGVGGEEWYWLCVKSILHSLQPHVSVFVVSPPEPSHSPALLGPWGGRAPATLHQ